MRLTQQLLKLLETSDSHADKIVGVALKDPSSGPAVKRDDTKSVVAELHGDPTKYPQNDKGGKEVDEFYVVFSSHEDHRLGRASWVGKVTKQFTNHWVEKTALGEPDELWGTKYMSYLSPDDIMTRIGRVFDSGYRIDGPFDTLDQAQEFVDHHYSSFDADE